MLRMLSLWVWSLPATAAPATPRSPTPAMAPIAIPTGQLGAHQSHQLGIKFVDHAQARLRPDGSPIFGAGLPSSETDSVLVLLREHDVFLTPRLDLPPQQLRRLEARATQRSGRAQPDLTGMMNVHPRQEQTLEALGALGHALQAHPLVEYAFIRTIAPPTAWRHLPPDARLHERAGLCRSRPGTRCGLCLGPGGDGRRDSALRL